MLRSRGRGRGRMGSGTYSTHASLVRTWSARRSGRCTEQRLVAARESGDDRMRAQENAQASVARANEKDTVIRGPATRDQSGGGHHVDARESSQHHRARDERGRSRALDVYLCGVKQTAAAPLCGERCSPFSPLVIGSVITQGPAVFRDGRHRSAGRDWTKCSRWPRLRARTTVQKGSCGER